MTNIWSSSSSPAAPFPKVFSDQNWCVLGNGNSRRGSHHPAVNTSPHIWTSGEHERPRGWYLKIQVWTKISIKHKPLKLSVYMWICMISCFNFTFVIGPIKYQPKGSPPEKNVLFRALPEKGGERPLPEFVGTLAPCNCHLYFDINIMLCDTFWSFLTPKSSKVPKLLLQLSLTSLS